MLRSFTDDSEKTKFCVACGNKHREEALFAVGDGSILIEKYCDTCATNVQRR